MKGKITDVFYTPPKKLTVNITSDTKEKKTIMRNFW